MPDVPRPRALVIGAGASGLVAARYLMHSSGRGDGQAFDTLILEAGACIGGTFANKTYDGTRLVSSTTLTSFSDFRFPEGTEYHVTAVEYVKYLEEYAAEFGLTERILFGCKVVSVQPERTAMKGDAASRTYAVVFELEAPAAAGYPQDFSALLSSCPKTSGSGSNGGNPTRITLHNIAAIAVCSGLHNVPSVPSFADIPGLEKATADGHLSAIHSSEYKDRSVFEGKNVLIVGCGETAMDLAYRAANTASCKSVAMIVRKGLLSIPHFLGTPDRPLDVFITNLFEHSHEHPWVHRAQLRWKISGVYIRLGLRLLGSGWGFNQWAFKVDPVDRGYHIINKSHHAIPHINAYVKKRSLLGRLSMRYWGECDIKEVRPLQRTSVREVQCDTNGMRKRVVFDNGEVMDDCDLIVFCTGYRQQFPFLASGFFEQQPSSDDVSTAPGCSSSEDERRPDIGKPIESVTAAPSPSPPAGCACFRHALGEDPLPPEHFIVHPEHPNMGFIGFVRPNVGAIPPMAELQTMWWLCRMAGGIVSPEPCMRTRREGAGSSEPRFVPSYMLLGQKYQYGVDYGNYMHRVAEDIGAAPTLRHTYATLGLRGLFTSCMGQAYVPLFRIRGPFSSARAVEVARNELYRACLDRGIVENLGLGLMTLFFAGLNLTAFGLEFLLFGVLRLGKRRGFGRYI